MQYKAVLAGLMATAVSAAPTPQDNVDIVGGTAAAAGEVNANTVVTAAHCTQGQTASQLSVRAGSLVSLFETPSEMNELTRIRTAAPEEPS
jgi:trypsin